MTPYAATLIANGLDFGWPKFDPLGRTFRDALKAGRQRAISASWSANDAVSTADFQALSIGTQIWIDMLRSRSSDQYAARWAGALEQTMAILAKKGGYNGESADELKTRAKGQGTTAALQFIEILAIIALVGLIIAGVIMFVVWQGRQTVDNQLARQTLERELVRIHGDAESVIARHFDAEQKAGHEIDWSEGELQYLAALEKAQQQIIKELGYTLDSPWNHPWPWLALGGVATIVLVTVIYREDIKRALGGRKTGAGERRMVARERRAMR